MIIKILQSSVFMGFIFFGLNAYADDREIFPTPLEAAIADTVSSVVAMNGGAVELNPLGLTVVTIVKFGLVLVVNEQLEGDEKYLLEKAESSIWTGATFNNLLVILNASPVTAIAVGIIAGVIVWNSN